jgi:hypothetical protein
MALTLLKRYGPDISIAIQQVIPDGAVADHLGERRRKNYHGDTETQRIQTERTGYSVEAWITHRVGLHAGGFVCGGVRVRARGATWRDTPITLNVGRLRVGQRSHTPRRMARQRVPGAEAAWGTTPASSPLLARLCFSVSLCLRGKFSSATRHRKRARDARRASLPEYRPGRGQTGRVRSRQTVSAVSLGQRRALPDRPGPAGVPAQHRARAG